MKTATIIVCQVRGAKGRLASLIEYRGRCVSPADDPAEHTRQGKAASAAAVAGRLGFTHYKVRNEFDDGTPATLSARMPCPAT